MNFTLLDAGIVVIVWFSAGGLINLRIHVTMGQR